MSEIVGTMQQAYGISRTLGVQKKLLSMIRSERSGASPVHLTYQLLHGQVSIEAASWMPSLAVTYTASITGHPAQRERACTHLCSLKDRMHDIGCIIHMNRISEMIDVKVAGYVDPTSSIQDIGAIDRYLHHLMTEL